MLRDLGVNVCYCIAQYLRVCDIENLKSTAKLGTFDEYIASIRIYNFWYIKKTQEWVNKIIRLCLFRHPYYNRTKSNIDLFHLPCSLKRAPTLPSKKQFVILREFLLCPQCQFKDVDCALWFSMGHKMAYSEPYIMFLCSSCAKVEAYGLFDYYHSPMISYYGEYTWVDA